MDELIETDQFKLNSKSLFSIIAVFVFVYVLIFEFTLPHVEFFPKPSLLYASFISLWKSYYLSNALFLTTSIIYISLIAGYILIYFSATLLLKLFNDFQGLINIVNLVKYFPTFFFAIIFIYWFNISITAEFIFAILIVISNLKLTVYTASIKINKDYIYSAMSLGLTENEVMRDVVWKNIQPEIFNSIRKIHNYLWVILLIYEFIGKANGIGSVYYSALLFKDLGALIALALFVCVLIWLGNVLIKYVTDKLIYWE